MIRRAFLAVLSVFVLAACGDDSTGPGSSIAGTYQLQTVNGQQVPATVVQAGNNKTVIASGSLILNQNNTFFAAMTIESTVNGLVDSETQASTGTYTRNNTSIQFTSEGKTVTGTLSGNTLTVSDTDMTLVYKK